MVAETEYYDILGISPDADERAIKKAYKKGALKWHPDRNLDNKEEAEEQFKKIGEAYQVLSDPEKKKIYDQFGKRGLQGGAGAGGGMGGFGGAGGGTHFEFRDASDLFSQMFGGRSPFDMFGGGAGGSRRMGGFQRGFGRRDESSDEDDIFSQFGGGLGGMGGMGGGGFGRSRKPKEVRHVINVSLEDLNEKKKKKIRMTLTSGEKKVFEFDLHGRMKSGTKVRYADAMGKGQDLVFEIKLKTHPVFEKNGVDLVMRRNVSLSEALCGTKFAVTRLNGTSLNVDTKNKVIKPDTVYRLKGEGLPYPGGKGDLHIHFNIQFPDSVSEDQRKKIKEAFPF